MKIELVGDLTTGEADPPIREFRWRSHGAAYCLNEECEGYLKPCFVLPTKIYWCPKCKELGIAKIQGFTTKNNHSVYKEVRVEFNYSPLEDRYKSVAIVIDHSILDDANVFTLYTPMYSTEKRALATAEQLLSSLLLVDDPSEVSLNNESILYIDEPKDMFKARLDTVSSKWLATKEKMERYKK